MRRECLWKTERKTAMSHGQTVPVAHGKDRRLFVIMVFILYVSPVEQGQALHQPWELWPQSHLYHIMQQSENTDRTVSALSWSFLVQYSQIHWTCSHTLATFIHTNPCRNAFKEGNISLTFFALALLWVLFADVSRFPVVLHCVR